MTSFIYWLLFVSHVTLRYLITDQEIIFIGNNDQRTVLTGGGEAGNNHYIMSYDLAKFKRNFICLIRV